jgi:hypothetical protein
MNFDIDVQAGGQIIACRTYTVQWRYHANKLLHNQEYLPTNMDS